MPKQTIIPFRFECVVTQEVVDASNQFDPHTPLMGAKPLRSKVFHRETIRRILMNETYVGDKRLQKETPTDFFTKRPDWTQQFESYYLSDDHEGIISREVWERAQDRFEEMKRRAAVNKEERRNKKDPE